MEYIFNHNGVAVVVEDEDDFCWGYYMTGDKITGDVWLFNIGETPDVPPWADGKRLPCQNPSENCYPHNISLPIVESDFYVEFNDIKGTAGIYFRELLIGVLSEGWHPGYSSFAKIDSGLAKAMDREVPRPT
jgi:hypothetical protein